MSQLDWRSPASYHRAEALDQIGFAWECLRRNPSYRRDCQALAEKAADPTAMTAFRRCWGLSFRS